MTLQPVQRAGDEEIAYLGAPEVVDQRVPVVVEALARVGVLEQVRAVEAGQAVRIGGEVRRHPVQQHAQSGGVRALDEAREGLRRAEARGRCEQPQRLVAPGAVERVLGHRQQFQVREAHVAGVGHQGVGEFVPRQPAIAILGLAAPTARMHLVDAHRRIERVRGAPLGRVRHRRRQRRDDGGGGRAQFGLPAVGVGLERQQAALGVEQFVLVARAGVHARQEDLPDAALAAQPHRVAPAVPEIEVADDAHARGIRCPHREAGAGYAIDLARQAAQHLEGSQVGAFGQQPGVHLAEHGAETVRVLYDSLGAVFPLHRQQPGPRFADAQPPLEQACRVSASQRAQHAAAGALEHVHRSGAGKEGAGPQRTLGVGVQPEHREGIAVAPMADQFDVPLG